MSDLPESIWADPPDIFDDMSIWYNYPTKGQTKYVRADIVQAQIDAAREAALQEVEAKLNSIDMRSCQFEWHPHTAGYIRSEFEKAIALICKGDQP